MSPDVLGKSAYINVGPALNPGDFALIRSEMFGHLGLRDRARLSQLVQTSGAFTAFHRPVL